MPRKPWANQTGTTSTRGYNTAHRAERARLKPSVERGETTCQQGLPGNSSSGRCLHPTRTIHPGQPWALGHNDTRTAWIGPVHTDCNQHDAATRGGRTTNQRHHRTHTTPTTPWTSRTW